MNRLYVSLILVVVILACGGYALYWYAHERSTYGLSETSVTPSNDLLAPREAPSGSTEYRNTRFRFSLFYPEGMKVETFSEGGSAMTFTFSDEAHAFQIFVVRYREPQVTPERFHMDVPSGVQKDLRNVTIDGVHAASFYSENAAVGETAEVWIIHGDYLYEITAPKALAGWLSDIMQSWKFL